MTDSQTEAFPVRVSRLAELTSTTRLFELVPAAGEPLPPFTAGAHIDLALGNGLVRSYSLVNDQADTHRYLIAVKLESPSSGGSSWIHDHLAEGSELKVYPPKNDFPLEERAAKTILIAGGIGVTPLISMCRRLLALGREFELHVCASSRETAPFADRLPKMMDDRLHFHFSESAGPDARLNVTALLAEPQPDTHIYVCGPKPLIEEVRAASSHWPAGSFHSELFSTHVHRLEDDAPDLSDAQPFEIVLASSGNTLLVPAEQTILETLLDNGIKVQAVCKQGWCGTCTTGLLGGKADHRDEYLEDDEKAANTAIQVCVSRAMPGERLILDL